MQANVLIIAISALLALGLSDCTKKTEPAGLLDTYWKLLELEGQPVTTAENARCPLRGGSTVNIC